MDNASAADISSVQRFSTEHVPSRARLRTIMGVCGTIFATAAPWGMGGLWVFDQTGLSNWWLWLFMPLGFLVVIASFIILMMTEGMYDDYYRHVMRGVVTEIDPNATRVFVDGYSWANERLQQWRKISPARWREVQVGEVIDFSPLNFLK